LSGKEGREAFRDDFVQEKIQEALQHRMPTCLLMLDFYIMLAVIICFGLAVTRYSKYLFDSYLPNFNGLLVVVIFGGVYFFIREVMQVWAFQSIGYFMTWLKDPTNHVDVICIIIMLVWPSLILQKVVTQDSESSTKEAFRSLSTVATGFLYLLVFSFLKRISKDFAIFVRGLAVVAKQLLSFLLVSVIILTAFALMFYVMFIGYTDCGPFCTFWSSCFEVYNMILGNYGPDDIFGIALPNYIGSVEGPRKLVIYSL
jgi:hypothetical protein